MTYTLNLDWPTFLAQHWQRHPCVIRQGFSAFRDPITPDELAGLAMEAEVDSRLVAHHDEQWQVEHGPFNRFDHLGERNWSLLVQAVNHWHDDAAQLMQPFRCLPDWRIDDLMISYSVPGGGVGPHIDQYDVFIIQGMGRRRWRVGEKKVLPAVCPHPQLLQVPPFAAIIDEVLEPGDILYIPPGFPHEGWSLESALNYSVGFRAPDSRELLSSLADYVLACEPAVPRYSDPDLTLRPCPARLEPHEIQRLQTLLRDLVADPAVFTPWLGEFLSQSRHELDIVPAEPAWLAQEVAQKLRQGATLQRVNGVRVIQIGEAIFVNGERLNLPPSAAQEVLTRHAPLDAAQLADALQDDAFLACLTDLINQGYWYFSDA